MTKGQIDQEVINADVEIGRAVWAVNETAGRGKCFRNEKIRREYIEVCCRAALVTLQKIVKVKPA